MGLQFIDVQRHGRDVSDTSSLSLSDKTPDKLGVLGSLDHGMSISFDANNARKMIDWLQQFVEKPVKGPGS